MDLDIDELANYIELQFRISIRKAHTGSHRSPTNGPFAVNKTKTKIVKIKINWIFSTARWDWKLICPSLIAHQCWVNCRVTMWYFFSKNGRRVWRQYDNLYFVRISSWSQQIHASDIIIALRCKSIPSCDLKNEKYKCEYEQIIDASVVFALGCALRHTRSHEWLYRIDDWQFNSFAFVFLFA